jgi:HlyD family secretion protein
VTDDPDRDKTLPKRSAPQLPAGLPRRMPALRRIRQRALVAAFQPDATVIEERMPRGALRLTLYGAITLIVTAIAWASLSHVDEVVTAPGKLITTQSNLMVQPLETSVIRSIDVAVGDYVSAGQKLATLDPTFTQSEVGQIRVKLDAANAEIKRLDAEITSRPFQKPDTGEDLMQWMIYVQRKAQFDAQVRSYDSQIALAQASLNTARADQPALITRLENLKQVEAMRTELFQRQTGSRLNMLAARDARLEVEQQLIHLRSTVPELEHKVDSARSDRQTFLEDFRRKMLEEMADARTRRDGLVQELARAQRKRDLVVLTAPADGIVLEVAQRSPGAVMREAEPLFTLVPLEAPLEAEVSIDAKDVGHVDTGQTVRIKVDAFPFQKYGTVTGSLRTLTQDAFPREPKPERATDNTAFYKARVRLTETKLHGLPEAARLIPGMTLVGEIKVGRRSVISYFLYPLLRGLDEGIREP